MATVIIGNWRLSKCVLLIDLLNTDVFL